MTQPDEFTPSGAINNSDFSSISGLAATSQGEMDANIASKTGAGPQLANDNLFDGMDTGRPIGASVHGSVFDTMLGSDSSGIGTTAGVRAAATSTMANGSVTDMPIHAPMRVALKNGTTPISGAGVIGVVRSNTVGVTPASTVVVTPGNLLVTNNFPTADTMEAEDNWVWDGTDGNIHLGCVKVICNGTDSELVSNEIEVVVGETIEVSCQVKWSGLTYTGSDPIQLGVQKYRHSRSTFGFPTFVDLHHNIVAKISSALPDPVQYPSNILYPSDALLSSSSDLMPSSARYPSNTLYPSDITSEFIIPDSARYPSDTLYPFNAIPVAGIGWVGIAGTYVVEPGVDQLRFLFRVPKTVTAGTVKWDEAAFLKVDLIDDNAVPGVGTTVDDIVTNLYGVEGEGFTHNEAAVSLANTASALTSVTAKMAALEAEIHHTGAIAGDDFSWNGEITSNVNWGGIYSDLGGQYVANGTDAVWDSSLPGPDYVANTTFLFDWEGTDEESTDDYQVIQLVLDSACQPSGGGNSEIYLLGRIAADWSKYVLGGFSSAGTYSIGWVSSGIFHEMKGGFCSSPGLGSMITLYCGDKGATKKRHFKLMIGSQVIDEFDESGTGSPLGAAQRKWGWGGASQGGVFVFIFFILSAWQSIPPKINQWLAFDQ